MLADLGLGGGQLVALEFEQGSFPMAGQRRVDQGLAAPPDRFVGRARLPVGFQLGSCSPEGIEQLALAIRVEERPAFVLAVDIDQPVAEPLQQPTVTGRPLTWAELRPWAETRRVTISSSSSSGPPRIASSSSRSDAEVTEKTAAALASDLPARTSSAEALPPSTSPSAVSKRLFPAPSPPSRR